MSTQCTRSKVSFQALPGRRLEGRFDGGSITSDAGLLLAREVGLRMGLFERIADCFTDHRDQRYVTHSVRDLVAQRVLALVAGYEDLNDHELLRLDPLFAAAVGKAEASAPLASPSTLNRLEHGKDDAATSRYRRLLARMSELADLFIALALDRHGSPPERIILDFDATDDRIHGTQEGRFFHGYYGHYCYLPLYIFWGDFPLVARLRTADQDGAAGSLEELQRIVTAIRARWSEVPILVRADSGFARDWLFDWCENNGVLFVIGMARNPRLAALIENELAEVEAESAQTGRSARRFKDLRYRTKTSWSRERRVVAKAEQLIGKKNPRFVVTNLPVEEVDAQALYEDIYAARGDMENRIKEQQLDLFADRTSAHTMRANQLRLWFSTFAYVLVTELRRRALQGTELARAQVGTIRSRLIKLGAVVRVSVRRVYLSMSSGFPMQNLFRLVLQRLQEPERLPARA